MLTFIGGKEMLGFSQLNPDASIANVMQVKMILSQPIAVGETDCVRITLTLNSQKPIYNTMT